MQPFRVEAVPTALADRVRHTRDDGHGNADLKPIHVDSHPGYICRHCLRDPAVGESVYLLTYSPFSGPAPYRNLGPVFLHTTPCERYGATDMIPTSLRHRLLSVRAYTPDHFMKTADVTVGHELEAMLERFFDMPEVGYIDIHNARPGCFNCRIRRGP